MAATGRLMETKLVLGNRKRQKYIGELIEMKRHQSLISLSRDHHSGLVLAQRLILGRSKAPRSDWPTDRRQQVRRVIEIL